MNNIYKNKNLKTLLIALILGFAGMTSLAAQQPQAFSVSDTDQVYFSPGNLQHIGSADTPYWKFADNQWDYFGVANYDYVNDNPNEDYDLFYFPTIGNMEQYGWRVLTREEWEYVFNTRSTASGIRYAKACVNDVNGMILLPDTWSADYYMLNSTNTPDANYSTNVITAQQWNALEQHGAIFLPAAGIWNIECYDVGVSGLYWSSSDTLEEFWNYDLYDSHWVHYTIFFSDSNFYLVREIEGDGPIDGGSVRLVRSAQDYYSVNATPNPSGGGTVSGYGTYQWGGACTLTATAAEGYTFFGWAENGVWMSTDAEYSFPVGYDHNLVAVFVANGNINFADTNVKTLCAANWDSNNDGELSYLEAASVTSLGDVFKNNTTIHSFNELQYFIGLTTIGEQAFYGCTELTQVTIPEYVASVGSKAFWNCPALQTVNFNAVNCTTMNTNNNYSVFSSDANGGDPAITRVNIGNGVTRIPDYAFKNASSIYPGLSVRPSVVEIGAHAFENCSSIATLAFANNSTLEHIGDYAFRGCSGLNRALNLPQAVTTVGQYAFYGCSQIPSLTIGENVETILDCAFWNCPALATVNFNATKCTYMQCNDPYYCSVFNTLDYFNDEVATPIVTLNIGANVTNIPPCAFYNSYNMISSIILPDAVTTVGEEAFYGCSSAPSLSLGENVEAIGYSAFYGCSGLTGELEIPASLISIESNAFYNCSGLTSVDYAGDLASWCGIGFGNENSNPLGYAHNLYFNDALVTEVTIPNTMNSIGQYAFQGCSNLTAVYYQGDLASWCGFSFGNEYSNPLRYAHNLYIDNELLTELIIPSTVTSIGQYTFQGCSSLTGDLVIPNAVTSIGKYAFSDCSGFNGSLFIGSGIQTINPYTFAGCTGFTGSLILGVQVNNIGDRAFENCNSFTLLISENPNPVTARNTSFNGMNYSIPVYVPDAMVSNYQNATGWNVFSNYIPQCTFWDNFDNANWSDEMNWLSMELPTANDVVCIAYNCDIDIDVNVLHAYVLNLNDVLTVKSGHALNTTYGLGILQPSQLVIEDGAQILNTLPGVQGTMQKHINGYGTGNDSWYLIASPLVGSIAPETVGNIFSAPEYDLYRFNQSTAAEWENYKTHTDDFFFENGTGYLYASQAEVTLAFAGTLNHESSKDVALSYDNNATFKGFNLVGNPFTCNAYLSNGEQYLEMNGDGSGFVLAEASVIPPMKGIFIEAAPDQDVVTFVTERPDSSGKSVTLRLNSNRGTNMDAVRVRLDGGKDMTKLVLNENSAKLYIPQNGKDYTVVNAPADNQMPVNFKTGTQGTYTLNVEIENANFGYLHLIDNLTGSDVDLLANPSYTFEAKPTDYAARFTLVFAESTGVEENTDAPFAFISNGNIIVNGEGVLQIVDVTGRVIVSRKGDVSGNVSTAGMTPGVYVVRLISGDNVKTQKVVVE